MKMHAGWNFPDADDFMWREMKPDGTYQAGHLESALRHVKDWSLAIDAGAHVGSWTRLMAARFDRVVSVEPSEDTFEALTANVRRLSLGNVVLRNVALGATPGFVSMVLDGRQAELANTGGRYVQPGGSIPVETIDSWHLPSLGFLKMDIEGSEPDCITGAALTIERCKPIVLFEEKGFARRFGHPKGASATILTFLGYRHLETTGRDQIWGPL